MKINLEVDAALMLRRLKNGEKRMAYAVVNAINKTALKIQEAEREGVREHFTVRDEAFIMRQAAIIKPFASVGKAIPYAEIAVGQKKRLLLAQFEEGGDRAPFKGKSVAVPIIGNAARPSFATPVPKALQFTQLKLRITARPPEGATTGRRRRSGKRADGRARVRYGLLGTYQVPGVGVFQRKAGSTDAELIYAFVKDEKLPKKLAFVDTADKVARQWFSELLQQEVVKTLARHANEL